MKKAVVKTGGKQYMVAEGDTLEIERLAKSGSAEISFNPLLVIDGEKIVIGNPEVPKASVVGETIQEVKDDKVTSIRFKAKKRVHKRRGHRQIKSVVRIKKINI